MDEQAVKEWQKEEARKFAERKLAVAERLVEAAELVLRTNGYTERADHAADAMESIHGALGG